MRRFLHFGARGLPFSPPPLCPVCVAASVERRVSVVCARVVVWSEWCVLPSSPSSPELDQQNEKKTNVHSQKN